MTAGDAGQPSVLAEKRGGIRILTLNRPGKLNAADLDMQEGLLRRLEEVAGDREARALILTGAGRAFSAGGDRDILRKIAEGTNDQQEALRRAHEGTIRCMLGLSIPAIAAIPGPAVGYGAGLVALCDMVVIGESGFLSDPHVHYGIPATTALQLMWPRLASEALARELLMTGRRVDAREALAIGLANRVCAAGEELATAIALAENMTALPADGIAQTKRLFNRALLAMAEELFAADG